MRCGNSSGLAFEETEVKKKKKKQPVLYSSHTSVRVNFFREEGKEAFFLTDVAFGITKWAFNGFTEQRGCALMLKNEDDQSNLHMMRGKETKNCRFGFLCLQ